MDALVDRLQTCSSREGARTNKPDVKTGLPPEPAQRAHVAAADLLRSARNNSLLAPFPFSPIELTVEPPNSVDAMLFVAEG